MKELLELSERWAEWCFIMNKISSPLCLCWNAIITVQVRDRKGLVSSGRGLKCRGKGHFLKVSREPAKESLQYGLPGSQISIWGI